MFHQREKWVYPCFLEQISNQSLKVDPKVEDSDHQEEDLDQGLLLGIRLASRLAAKRARAERADPDLVGAEDLKDQEVGLVVKEEAADLVDHLVEDLQVDLDHQVVDLEIAVEEMGVEIEVDVVGLIDNHIRVK